MNFRGIAGEVVVLFLRPRSFFTMFALMVIIGTVTVLGGLALGEGAALISTIISVAFFGRMAVAAGYGDLEAGIFSSSLKPGGGLAFMWRYLFGLFLFFIPWGGLAYGFSKQTGLSLLSSGGLTGAAGSGLAGLVSFVLLILLFAGPAAIALCVTGRVTGAFDTISDGVYSVLERRSDLVIFFASTIGGAIVFLFIYGPVFMIFTAMVAQLDIAAGLVSGIIGYMIPSVAGMVLGARMTGAFVWSGVNANEAPKTQISLHGATSVLPDLGNTKAAAALFPVNTSRTPYANASILSTNESIEKRKAAEEALRKQIKEIVKENAGNPDAAAAKLEEIAQQHPDSPWCVFELMRLYVQQKNEGATKQIFPRVVQLSRTDKLDTVTVKVFQSFPEETRLDLNLTRMQLGKLERLCLAQKEFLDAWWCTKRAFDLGQTDAQATQKRSFEIAEAASASANHQVAAELYELVLENFPDSTFADFAKTCLKQEQSKIQ